MPPTRWFIFAALLLAAAQLPATESSPPRLWYQQPAEKWTEALPIGNGRLGAMVFGGVFDERIQFNEDTLWTGQPHDYVRAGAGDQLAEIRRRLAAGQVKEASALAKSNFLSDPVRQKAYQPFGDLHLHFPGQGEVTEYRRELDLDTAIATTTFQLDGVTFKREVFASNPDQAIVLHLTADKPGQINFTLKLDSPHTNSQTSALTANSLILTGQVESGGLKFESRVQVMTAGGTTMSSGNELIIDHANSATLILVAATSFKNFQDISADPARRCTTDLNAAAKKDYPALLAAHLADYQKLFRRVNLDLGRTDAADLPTDVRLKNVHTAGIETDPALAALHFQYGRYLLIASSRPGGQPANLQGLWNEDLNPPWESKWTLNINCEMNYWPAELCNLSECTGPLFDMIDDLAISGARTAKAQYGARGWVVHHNTDLWRGTAPINNIDGIWPTGGAWLCYHLWEHYLFTGDKKFLARAYPVMKSASEFFMDDLVKDPKTGWLVSSPSFSPEEGGLCIGPTMDHQLIRALMDATLASAKILGKDKKFAAQLAAVRLQVAPDQIGRHGQLQEWLEDIDVPNNNHRHMSPLFALYPGAEITPAQTNLFAAAKVLLQWRGDGSTGWSYAWRMPLWARVGDGDFALRQFNGLLQKRTLPNLFDLCGPFQIDGNFGACAGVAEMLVQSQQTQPEHPDIRIIELLPALPKAWPDGSVTGLCARGGFAVDITWHGGKLTHAVIRSKLGNPYVVRYGGKEIQLATPKSRQVELDSQLAAVLD
ncbi:MAG: glycoside hydrolase N-terminal domain-containing protein [Verrucomicrobiae bacterium]|nr:glycoside hydrolase N-terminal domain-containing protein [Verrucomicrobiae bacterium]